MNCKKYTCQLGRELNTFRQQSLTIHQILAKESVQHEEYLTSSNKLCVYIQELLKINIATYSESSQLTVYSDKLQPLLVYFNSRLTNQIELYQSEVSKREVLDTMSDFSLFAVNEVIKLYESVVYE